MDQNPNINNVNSGITGPNAFAVASFVCAIAAATCWGSFISLILGIVGLVLAIKAKKGGNVTGLRKAGFILSIIAVVFGVISLIVTLVAVAGIVSLINFIGGNIQTLLDFLPK